MALYKLFSNKIEIQYKSYFMSKAMLFIVVTSLLNIILPFIIAYRSRGFWLKSHYFYEKPTIRMTYDYLLVAETDDPSIVIICGDHKNLSEEEIEFEEHCSEVHIQEWDINGDGKNDMLEVNFKLNVLPEQQLISMTLFLGIDFQITSTCPLQMQSLAIFNKEFVVPANELNIYGDIQFYQKSHLQCLHNVIDTKYNVSLFDYQSDRNENIISVILEQNLHREVNTKISNVYTKTDNGHTGSMDVHIKVGIADMQFKYQPNMLQEMKWAWPQYLSLALIFYWIFNRIKMFVFKNRLLMAWEVIPWSKKL